MTMRATRFRRESDSMKESLEGKEVERRKRGLRERGGGIASGKGYELLTDRSNEYGYKKRRNREEEEEIRHMNEPSHT